MGSRRSLIYVNSVAQNRVSFQFKLKVVVYQIAIRVKHHENIDTICECMYLQKKKEKKSSHRKLISILGEKRKKN